MPARRKNAISILSSYSNTFAAFWPFRPPGTSIGVDLTLGHFKQLSREPRRIEILGQRRSHIFAQRCPSIDVFYDPFFMKNGATLRRLLPHARTAGLHWSA